MQHTLCIYPLCLLIIPTATWQNFSNEDKMASETECWYKLVTVLSVLFLKNNNNPSTM